MIGSGNEQRLIHDVPRSKQDMWPATIFLILGFLVLPAISAGFAGSILLEDFDIGPIDSPESKLTAAVVSGLLARWFIILGARSGGNAHL